MWLAYMLTSTLSCARDFKLDCKSVTYPLDIHAMLSP